MRGCEQNMEVGIKSRIIMKIGISAIISIFLFCGCEKQGMNYTSEEVKQNEKVLVESEIDLPEQLQESSNIILQRKENAYIIAALTEESSIHIWENQESGWKLIHKLLEDLGKSVILNTCVLTEDGSFWCNATEDGKDKYYQINTRGETKEFDVDILGANDTESIYAQKSVKNRFLKFCFNGNSLIAVDLFGNIYELDSEKAEVTTVHDLKRQENINDAVMVGDSIIELAKGRVYSQNIKDGLDEETKLQKFLESEYKGVDILEIQQLKDSVYILTKNKLEVFNLNESSKGESIFIDSPNLLRDDIVFQNMYVKDSHELYISVHENGVGKRLFKLAPEKEQNEKTNIEIFCLSGDKVQNSGIEDGITRFKAVNSNIEIELTYGIEVDSTTTVTEAINTLNTQMLVGEGPDIIITDGLNIEPYVENELLLDLSDEIKKDKDELFMNLIGSDKKIYTVPTSFGIFGEVVNADDFVFSDNVNKITENLNNLQPQNIFSQDSACALIGTVLNMKTGLWSKAKKVSNSEIKDLLNMAKNVYSHAYKVQDTYGEFNVKNAIMYESNVNIGVNEILWEKSRLAIGNILYPEDLFFIYKIGEWREGIQGGVLESGTKKYYIPYGKMSISSQTENKEEAYKFIEYMLSEEVQSRQISAFSINKAAFQRRYSRTDLFSGMMYEDGNGQPQTLQSATASLQEVENAKELLSELNYEVSVNDALKSIFADGIVSYINGNEDLDAITENVYQKLQIVFAE